MSSGWASAGRVRGDVGDVTGCVVVGTDGSDCGRRALRFAAHEAEVRGCPLVVVRAWSLTTAPPPGGGEPGVVPPLSSYEAAVEHATSAEVIDALGAKAARTVDVRAVHDNPGDVLVAASRHAVLVVVGSRGLGVVAEMLLGSVSAHLAHHAHGPVAIVR